MRNNVIKENVMWQGKTENSENLYTKFGRVNENICTYIDETRDKLSNEQKSFLISDISHYTIVDIRNTLRRDVCRCQMRIISV